MSDTQATTIEQHKEFAAQWRVLNRRAMELSNAISSRYGGGSSVAYLSAYLCKQLRRLCGELDALAADELKEQYARSIYYPNGGNSERLPPLANAGNTTGKRRDGKFFRAGVYVAAVMALKASRAGAGDAEFLEWMRAVQNWKAEGVDSPVPEIMRHAPQGEERAPQ